MYICLWTRRSQEVQKYSASPPESFSAYPPVGSSTVTNPYLLLCLHGRGSQPHQMCQTLGNGATIWRSITVHACVIIHDCPSMIVHETQKCNHSQCHGGLMKQVHDSCHGLNDHVMSCWVYMHCQPSQLRVHDKCHQNDVHIVWPRRDCFMQHGQTHSSECMWWVEWPKTSVAW